MTKLNQFNIKYRLSNLDVARISEGLKTGRGGILNIENWAYATLRAPDYLNRMVLFVARMRHDGCYDAYTLTKDGRLKYDWRKDKRFNLLATDNKTDLEKYNKQKSLYYSLVRLFNLEGYKKENGELLNFSDDLPDAYTLQEISNIKLLADTIYGSYNQSTRAKYENTAIGRNFVFFSTWMNGIVDVYLKLTLVSLGEIELKQEVDYNGNALFFNLDGTITNENTGIPVMKNVPVMVLGIWYTLSDMYKTLKHCGLDENGNWSFKDGWKAVKKDILTNSVALRNLKRLLRDMLISLILTALFKLFLNNVYKDYKKKVNGDNVITNACVEILYKGSSSCFDTFMGPFAMLDYIGNSTNPATYRLQSKIFNDLFSFCFGDKTFGLLAMGSSAFLRTFLDTYTLWERDNLK